MLFAAQMRGFPANRWNASLEGVNVADKRDQSTQVGDVLQPVATWLRLNVAKSGGRQDVDASRQPVERGER